MDTSDDLRRRYQALRQSELIDRYRSAADLRPEARKVLAAVMHEKGIFVPENVVVDGREDGAAEGQRFPKVYFARRLNADTLDGVLGLALLTVPMMLVSSHAASLPEAVRRLGIAGVPAGILYGVFRDAIGKGTSMGKRTLGLRLVDLRTGDACSARHTRWRNILDLVPVLNLIDFILMCVDARGQKIMDKQLGIQLIDRHHVHNCGPRA